MLQEKKKNINNKANYFKPLHKKIYFVLFSQITMLLLKKQVVQLYSYVVKSIRTKDEKMVKFMD